MPVPRLPKAGLTLAFACLASLPSWATQPASLILHNAKFTPWVVGIANESNNPGKLKIFDKEPLYDEDGELKNGSEAVAELRNYGETYKLSLLKKKYWLVFYPKWTLLNLTATFRPENKQEASAGKLNVKQSIIKGVGGLKLEVKVTDTQDAKLFPNVEYFEDAKAGALLTLN